MTLALVFGAAAIAACLVSVAVVKLLFAGDVGRVLPSSDLEAQVAALRTMVLQLRVELAEAQRENEESRTRDLELLRLRGEELVREAEVRAGTSDRAVQRRGEAWSREALSMLRMLHEAEFDRPPRVFVESG